MGGGGRVLGEGGRDQTVVKFDLSNYFRSQTRLVHLYRLSRAPDHHQGGGVPLLLLTFPTSQDTA